MSNFPWLPLFDPPLLGSSEQSDPVNVCPSPGKMSILPKPYRFVPAALLGVFGLHLQCLAAPNIVFILVDDLGWTDISAGNPNLNNKSLWYQTPNIQRLANEGISFTHCYTQQNCEPSRSALFTGQFPPVNGVYNVDSLDRGNNPNAPIVAAPQRADINPAGVSIFETLKTAGYHIGLYGKNHGTGPANQLGVNHGIDTNFASSKQFSALVNGSMVESAYSALLIDAAPGYPQHWGFDIPALDPYAQPYNSTYNTNVLLPVANGNNVTLNVGKPKHHVDAVTDAAVDFIKNRAAIPATPFMLYFPITGVHSDHVSRVDLKVKYQNITSTDPRHTDNKYAGLVETVDQSIGRLLNALADPNGDGNTADSIVNNTIVVFTSDNGSTETSLSTPLSGEKGMLSEGGIRVPLIVRRPGVIPANTISNQPVHLVDFYPTLAALAGATLPSPGVHPLDGVSFASILTSPTTTLTRNLYWHFPGYMDTRCWPQSIIQKVIGNQVYKLIYRYESGVYQLFNLTNDIDEGTNIFASNQSIASTMNTELRNWLIAKQARTGTWRATGATVAYPPSNLIKNDGPPANTHGYAFRFWADSSGNPFWGGQGFTSTVVNGTSRRVSKTVTLNSSNFVPMPAGKSVSFKVTFDIVPSVGTLVNRNDKGVGIDSGSDVAPHLIDGSNGIEAIRIQNITITNVVFVGVTGGQVKDPRIVFYRPSGNPVAPIVLSTDSSLTTTTDNQTEAEPSDNFDNHVEAITSGLSLFASTAASQFTLRGLEIDCTVVIP